MNNKKLYSVKELEEIMSIGQNVAYKLIKLPGFPTIKIGNKILIPSEALDEWINQNVGSEIIL